MKTYLFAILATVLFFSCKKEDCKPMEVEKLVYIKDDSTHTTDTIKIHTTDTVYINNNPIPLIGVWTLYKFDNYTKNTLVSSDSPNFTCTFTATEFILKTPSGTDTYKATYGQGYMEISLNNSVPTTYFVENINNGKEYKLTKSPGAGNYQVWFFKK